MVRYTLREYLMVRYTLREYYFTFITLKRGRALGAARGGAKARIWRRWRCARLGRCEREFMCVCVRRGGCGPGEWEGGEGYEVVVRGADRWNGGGVN